MESYDLWEALGHWFSGETLGDDAIGQVPVHLIDRTGGFLSLLGGFAVILDLAGPQRLRRWGQHLHSQPMNRLRQWVGERKAFVWSWLVLIWLLTALFTWRTGGVTAHISHWESPLGIATGSPYWDAWISWAGFYAAWAFSISIQYVVVVNFLKGRRKYAWKVLFFGIIVLALLNPVRMVSLVLTMLSIGIAVLAAMLLFIALDLAMSAIDIAVMRPLALALDLEAESSPGKPIRWIGFLVILIGQLLQLFAT